MFPCELHMDLQRFGSFLIGSGDPKIGLGRWNRAIVRQVGM